MVSQSGPKAVTIAGVRNHKRRSSMTRRLLIALAVLLTTILAAPSVGHAQAFKVEKFDIKGEGGTDYVAVEAATGRVFVSRASHMMVIEGATGKVLGDIPNTPGVHGAGIATKAGHGFTTNGGDETVTMFDLKTLAVLRQIKVGPGLDGIFPCQPHDGDRRRHRQRAWRHSEHAGCAWRRHRYQGWSRLHDERRRRDRHHVRREDAR